MSLVEGEKEDIGLDWIGFGWIKLYAEGARRRCFLIREEGRREGGREGGKEGRRDGGGMEGKRDRKRDRRRDIGRVIRDKGRVGCGCLSFVTLVLDVGFCF
mmetsp:Transcript_6612/g.12755  ORF Transcript_6612/g.12755 Transcript_6612/m.12755 type:complete len:101 (-) Transcript_6612:74-376(-)